MRPPSQESYQQTPSATTAEFFLRAGQTAELDPSYPYREARDHAVLGHIRAGSYEFLVLDLNNSRVTEGYLPFGEDIIYSQRFLLVDRSFDPSDLLNRGFKEISDQEVIIGRRHQSTRFNYCDNHTISRQHFSIREDAGKVIVSDLESLNGTFIQRGTNAAAKEQSREDAARKYYSEMRRKEAADLRARQARQAKENAARQAAKQRGPSKPATPYRQPFQDPAERKKQLDELRGFVRSNVEQFEPNYPDLDIASIAKIISSVHNSRLQNKSDREIYMDFARTYHPDRLNDLPAPDRAHAETSFKLIGDMYNQGTKSFQI